DRARDAAAHLRCARGHLDCGRRRARLALRLHPDVRRVARGVRAPAVTRLFDLHVHSAPCLFPRRGDDLTTARWYEEAGAAGIVLKSHFEATAGRAILAAAQTKIEVYG